MLYGDYYVIPYGAMFFLACLYVPWPKMVAMLLAGPIILTLTYAPIFLCSYYLTLACPLLLVVHVFVGQLTSVEMPLIPSIPTSLGENVHTLLYIGRLVRKSIPLGPQSIPLGTCLSTHLATQHLPLCLSRLQARASVDGFWSSGKGFPGPSLPS